MHNDMSSSITLWCISNMMLGTKTAVKIGGGKLVGNSGKTSCKQKTRTIAG